MKGQKFHYAQKQFAEGMKGDEDLGEDITMKGQKFHYAQQWRNKNVKEFICSEHFSIYLRN